MMKFLICSQSWAFLAQLSVHTSIFKMQQLNFKYIMIKCSKEFVQKEILAFGA